MRTGSSLRRITGMASVLAVTIAAMAASPARAENATPAGYVEIGRKLVPAEVDTAHATPVAYLIIDADGKTVTDALFKVEVINGQRYLVTFRPSTIVGVQRATSLNCEGWNSPIPTYSWSNHTVHYGMQAVCTGEPILLRARGSLWSGPDYTSTNTLQAALPGKGDWAYGAGNAVSVNRVRQCVDWGGFDWWELVMYFEVSRAWGWAQFVPYPARAFSEIQCVDIA